MERGERSLTNCAEGLGHPVVQSGRGFREQQAPARGKLRPLLGRTPGTRPPLRRASRTLSAHCACGQCHHVHLGLFISPFPAFLRSAQLLSKARPAGQVRPVENQGLWLVLLEGGVPEPLSRGRV